MLFFLKFGSKIDDDRVEKKKLVRLMRITSKNKSTAPNRQFGASGGVVSWDTSQDFRSSAPVRALPIPPPAAKLLKRYLQADDSSTDNKTAN